jgi:hypothetical protein
LWRDVRHRGDQVDGRLLDVVDGVGLGRSDPGTSITQ